MQEVTRRDRRLRTGMTDTNATGPIPESAEMTASEREQMGRKHVFCVNGSSVFLEFVRTLLEEESYNVTTTNFVPATFSQVAALHPELLIIDLEAGRRAGWELLERLHHDATTHDIPVIIVSTDQQLLERARNDPDRYGGAHFIAKPFDIVEMLTAVHDLIGAA